ncbi:protein kinase [Nocardiopsis alba]|uniref:protein kinase n=1 Tax=Nocardiopsis alba TaxID=53437 RepID=UPI00366F03DE
MTSIPFNELIHPYTGDVLELRPVEKGHGWSTTAIVVGEKGEFFVKGVPNRPGGRLDSARREAAINPTVQGISPTMRWQAEDEKWFVMGFDLVQGRAADFGPDSSDRERVVEVLNRVSALPVPDIARGWQETRWDRFATDEERELLAGDTVTYTDIHENNVLIERERTWLLDWAWPTLGASVITPSCLAVQLIASGHTPDSALGWVSGLEGWKTSSEESAVVFARVDVRMHRWSVEARPEEEWLKAMLVAAEAWVERLR